MGHLIKQARWKTAMNKKLNPILTELRQRFEALYRTRLVRLVLYGSQARDDAEPGSDIDVLVVLEGPVNPGDEIERAGEITAQLSLLHDTVISCAFVSSERFNHEQSPLLLNVRREGIPL
jgi:predicted nucleotidyltransferase